MERDKDLINGLLLDSKDHLNNIEPDLLELEHKGNSVSGELVNRVFRAVHSIKGGFSFFGYDNIKNLSHAMENIFSKIRDRKLTIDTALTDSLLTGIDKLHVLLDNLDTSDSISIQDELDKLQPFQDVEIETADTKVVKQSISIAGLESILGEDIIKKLLKQGKRLYIFTAHKPGNTKTALNKLQKEASMVGEIIEPPVKAGEDAESPKSGDSVSFYLASVLDSSLLTEATNFKNVDMQEINLFSIKQKLKQESRTKEAKKQSDKKKQDPQQGGGQDTEVLRVKVRLLNKLMNLAGELVLGRNQIIQRFNTKFLDFLETINFKDTLEKGREDFYRNAHSLLELHCKDLPPNTRETLNHSIRERLDKLFADIIKSFSFNLVDIPGMNAIVQNLDLVTTELQENIMQTRMQRIATIVDKFPRVVRDLANILSKDVKLTVTGRDVELDKSIIELLSDPLTHIIRNCVDHGIELPEKRRASGKSEQGQILLHAFHEGGKVHVMVEDDGVGINHEALLAKAVANGVVSNEEASKLSIREIHVLAFHPGLSTAKKVSDLSGRGVGMDVVKSNIERLGGNVAIDSQPGKGTRITLILPLTLAIIPSLLVSTEGHRFAIPQVGIEELVRIRAGDIAKKVEKVHRAQVLRLRGQLLPIISLADVLGVERTYSDAQLKKDLEDRRQSLVDRRAEQEKADKVSEKALAERRNRGEDRRQNPNNALKIIVLRTGDQQFGLIVDEVYDSEEIVVKPLSGYLKSCKIYAGSAIMGDGKVVMILDPTGISENCELNFFELEKEAERLKASQAKERAVELQKLLLFNNGGSEHFAISLNMVARIERIDPSSLETVGSKHFLRYDDTSLRLLQLKDYIQVSSDVEDLSKAFVIVPKQVSHPLGLIAGKVEDIIESPITLDSKNVNGRGILGSVVLDKKLITILDVYGLLQAAEPELYSFLSDTKFLAGKRVLLAQNTEYYLKVLGQYLGNFGCIVDTAVDGNEAWVKLNSREMYDYVITDTKMPGMDGFTLAERVKGNKDLSCIPIVATTAGDVEDLLNDERSINFSACQSLFNKEGLKKTLETVIGES